MKIKIETYTQRSERLAKWHKRFAWFPTWFDGSFVWLSFYEYREEFRLDNWHPYGGYRVTESRLISEQSGPVIRKSKD